jgi:molybdenum cofactor guanylyltransferase
MFTIPCVLFAGGKSSRMGQDKSLLPFGGYASLAQYQYNRLSQLFTDVYISTKTTDKFDFDAHFILDSTDADYAPTAGFVSAFDTLLHDSIFVLSVDTPFVDETVISTLIDADAQDLDAIIAKTSSGSHPMCGIYHRSLLEPFRQMGLEGNHRLGKLLSLSNTRIIEFENEELFMNLNHPHEYEAALIRYNTKEK